MLIRLACADCRGWGMKEETTWEQWVPLFMPHENDLLAYPARRSAGLAYIVGSVLLLSNCNPAPEPKESRGPRAATSKLPTKPAVDPLAWRLNAVGLKCANVMWMRPIAGRDSEYLVTCVETAGKPRQVEYILNDKKGTARLPQARDRLEETNGISGASD